jgi:GH25 family lysozyme M1 (1,4-beta-N-acetylmuramidase)
MLLLTALALLSVVWIALASPLNTTIVPRSQGYLPSTPSEEAASSIAKPRGIDVSGHQTRINWRAVKSNGIAFAYIKATEGTRE